MDHRHHLFLHHRVAEDLIRGVASTSRPTDSSRRRAVHDCSENGFRFTQSPNRPLSGSVGSIVRVRASVWVFERSGEPRWYTLLYTDPIYSHAAPQGGSSPRRCPPEPTLYVRRSTCSIAWVRDKGKGGGWRETRKAFWISNKARESVPCCFVFCCRW